MPPTMNPAPRATRPRLRVGGEDRLGGVLAAVGRERRRGGVDAREQRSSGNGAPITPVERTITCSGASPRSRRACAAVARASAHALRAHGGVRDARVDHDRLWLGDGEVLLRDDDGCGVHAVLRPHGGAGRGRSRADDREVLSSLADLRVHTRGEKPLAAVTLIRSPPFSRSPAVSSSPSARLAFCTAWPAAPLPRLSSAQTTIAVPVGTVLEDAELCGVRALHARELGRDALGKDAHEGGPWAYAASSSPRTSASVVT